MHPNTNKSRPVKSLPALGAGLLITPAILAMVPPDNTTGQTDNPRSMVQRGRRQPPPPPEGNGGGGGPMPGPHFPEAFRTIDGTRNHPGDPTWGAAGISLLRVTPVAYDDQGQTPAENGRQSARVVSNLVNAQDTSVLSDVGASDYLWQWGQFLDHDIDETPIADPSEAFDILVPAGDPWFDPTSLGTVTIPLDRSAYSMIQGVRQQFNNITAYVDASNVYGADDERALELRTLDGTGRLNTSDGDLLPFNVNGFDNAPTNLDPTLFLAGDIRVNEQIALTAMHTLFVREHNYHADQIGTMHPELSGDEIYEHARAVVAAEMQAITYREFLPVLLGENALPPYNGFRPQVNPGISNVFATAAYRVGHTMLSPQLLRTDSNGLESDEGHIALANGFFRPQEIIDNDIDSLLRGMASQTSQRIDTLLIDDVRNFLFGPPGSGGFDLASLNIQRGRDHGLARYVQVRTAFGRPPVQSFDQITPDPDVQAALSAAYGSVQDVDAWVGLLAEPHRPGAVVGETLYRVLRDQFLRLRDGDRFWYQSYMPPPMVRMIEDQTLATIIRRNTNIGVELQDNVFIASDSVPCVADLDGDSVIGVNDMLMVILAWGPCPPGCPNDMDNDGQVGVIELLAVITGWGNCP